MPRCLLDLDRKENFEKAEERIRTAALRGGQIVCLQELFRSQYFCREENADLFALAESIPGPSTQALGKLARELDIVILASLFERRAPGLAGHGGGSITSPLRD